MPLAGKRRGTFVISLDLELAWGVRDIYSIHDSYMVRVIHERRVVPRILALFEKYHIRATWAAVGMMFARSRGELEDFSPSLRPQYKNHKLDPYRQNIGEGEEDDPLHFGYSLISKIQAEKSLNYIGAGAAGTIANYLPVKEEKLCIKKQNRQQLCCPVLVKTAKFN